MVHVKNFHTVSRFVKIMPKILLVPFFLGTVYCISCRCVPTDRVAELEEQVRQGTEHAQQLQDELTKMRRQLQQQEVMAEDNRHRVESDLTESKNRDQEKASDAVFTDGRKLMNEIQSRLLDQLPDILWETTEKVDQKQRKFPDEIEQLMTNFVQQKSSEAQDELPQRYSFIHSFIYIRVKTQLNTVRSKK